MTKSSSISEQKNQQVTICKTSEPLRLCIDHFKNLVFPTCDSSTRPSTERLEGVIEQYMHGKEILFSQEYHTEENPGQIHANGGFFIVRNTEAGRGLLRAWYDVPELESHKQYKRENPQGLNFCWDSVMQPRHSDITVLAPFELFSCPRGQFVRHNWFKDLSFEAELQEVVLQRRLEAGSGCVLCDEFHLIDLVRQHDRAVHGKAWVNNR